MISHVSFAFLFAAIATLLASPAHGDMINALVGVNFQPYIGAWSGNPLAPPLFNSYTYADVLADLQTVKARGFGSIKTYGVGTSPFSGNGDNLDSNQYNVQAANALGLGVYLGANLQFANGGLDMVRTKMEIDLAIKQAAAYPGTVKTLIVGNESIGVNGVTVADMVSLMDYAKTQRTASGFTAATLPVTTVQQWGVLAGSANQALSQAAEGSIYANIYRSSTPIHRSTTPSRSSTPTTMPFARPSMASDSAPCRSPSAKPAGRRQERIRPTPLAPRIRSTG